MMRALIITAAASFVLALACFAGAAALGGRDLFENGWTIDPSYFEFGTRDSDENVHITIGGKEATLDEIPDVEPPEHQAPTT